MWIKPLPEDYLDRKSFCYEDVFLWQEGNVFVMDNHKSALWCWLQVCNPDHNYNFMHIDRHYDLLDCFNNDDLEAVRNNPHLGFDEFSRMMRAGGEYKVFRWDNYIMAGYVLNNRWFHTNIFMTHEVGGIKPSWGHEPLRVRNENPLFMEWCINQFIGEPSKYLDGFNGDDYLLPWIVNLDLDVFFTGDSLIQQFSDEYIKRIAEILQNNLERIEVLTIALSPECLGGAGLRQKWKNGFRLISIMSERLECLRIFEQEKLRIANH